MAWRKQHDRALLDEITVSDLFLYKKGKLERGQVWDSVPDNLNAMDYPKFKDIPDSIRKQFIRDAYTCMRAQCEGEKISSQDFVMVAKKVCRKKPQRKDQEPVGLKLRGDFAYYVSSFTLNALVCLQSCHFFNRVEEKGEGVKKGVLKFSCCCTVSELWTGLFMNMMQFLCGKYNTAEFIGPVVL